MDAKDLTATSSHGPCDNGEDAVKDRLPLALEGYLREWCLQRLSAGEKKYGAVLRVGWTGGKVALAEELADAINYAICIENWRLADLLAEELTDLFASDT